MELIVIDENKLKIMLSAPDMQHYALRTERMSGANEETRRAFRHIFDDARDRIGFETEGERLFVQLYTSRGGGCEIFVTKLGSPLADFDSPDAREITASHEQALLDRLHGIDQKAEKETPAMCEDTEAIVSSIPRTYETAYRFHGLPPLLEACHRLQALPCTWSTAAAYIHTSDGSEDWYLFLSSEAPLFDDIAFLSEYAHEVGHITSLRLYLDEYGHTVCPERAVETLGQL